VSKIKVATIWLDGCSGCHMSFLDLDERLVELSEVVDIVYGPLVDTKEFPEGVDLTIVEGAVSSRDDWEKIRLIRRHTKVLLSLGDCAVTGNVPSMRNTFALNDVLDRAYAENVDFAPQTPRHEDLPPLLARVRPVHEVVRVDVFVQGCPPPPDAIYYALTELVAGRMPDMSQYTRFGR
jgi:NAD-reducing hydrogenase small subunit